MKISSYLYHHIYHTALSLAEWFYPRDELFKALGLKSFKGGEGGGRGDRDGEHM